MAEEAASTPAVPTEPKLEVTTQGPPLVPYRVGNPVGATGYPETGRRPILVRYSFSNLTRPSRVVYLVKRGPRPETHKAPFHPVVICSRRHTMKWESGWTGGRSWVWDHEGREEFCGWLLLRWEGLDIDYGGLVKCCTLPDGTKTGFFHRHRDLGYDRPGEVGAKHLGYSTELQEPWSLLPGAVWWSDHPMPEWLRISGVVPVSDSFSLKVIQEDTGTCLLTEREGRRLQETREK